MSATFTSPAVPEQGQLAEVRQRRFLVTDVRSSSPTPIASGKPVSVQHLVSLSSIEDDALGEEPQVIWEIEPGAHVHEKMALPEPVGFDEPERLDAFLDAVQWGAASVADARLIQSPFRSGIEIEPYQLDPVVRAVQMPRVNLLIADDVGLGKTIEAGLVLLELILGHRPRRMLVVCPASLQVKWQTEMRDRFGLEFRIVDSKLMRELRRSRGLHANPWTHFPRLITSIDFLKRERPLRQFREVLPAPGEPISPAPIPPSLNASSSSALFPYCHNDGSCSRKSSRGWVPLGASWGGLNLIDDSARQPIPYEVFRAIEDSFLEKRPHGNNSHSYTRVPRAANDLKARLFEMAKHAPQRARSAYSLLGQIEEWRLEYGRPTSEPRHPIFESGDLWPPTEPATVPDTAEGRSSVNQTS
jgi:hypothetical protein